MPKARGESAHTLQADETLEDLAWRAYGDVAQWRRIAAANGIDDPSQVKPGQTLRIPPVEEEGDPQGSS